MAEEQRCWVFWVPDKPRGKERPRVVVKKGLSRTYTPKKTEKYEQHVMACAMLAGLRGIDKYQCYAIDIEAFKHDARARSPQQDGAQLDVCKPDADNVAKAILDALGIKRSKRAQKLAAAVGLWAVGFLGDDGKVAGLRVRKWRWKGPAGVAISIKAVDPLAQEPPGWAVVLAKGGSR
jgi:Holliday junction resolvase RusA-like endonuclease